MFAFKDPVGRPARWALHLQAYDYECKYRAGGRHGDADGLSRLPVDMNTQAFSENQTDRMINAVTEAQETQILEVPVQVPFTMQSFRELQNTDTTLQPLVTYIEEGTLPPKWSRRKT